MDMERPYIDTKTFDIHQTKPEGIESFAVDPLIANTISILNKKGYLTEVCCQGHRPWYNDHVSTYNLSDKGNIKRIKNGDYEIISSDKNKIYFVVGIAQCHIRFNENVELKQIPKGFRLYRTKMYDNSKPWVLETSIPAYYQKNDVPVKKPNETVEQEIENVNKQLNEWAVSLPDLSKNKIRRTSELTL